jgi:hypothetical protein
MRRGGRTVRRANREIAAASASRTAASTATEREGSGSLGLRGVHGGAGVAVGACSQNDGDAGRATAGPDMTQNYLEAPRL